MHFYTDSPNAVFVVCVKVDTKDVTVNCCNYATMKWYRNEMKT